MIKSSEKINLLLRNGYSEEVVVFPIVGYHAAYVYNIPFSIYVRDAKRMAETQYKVLKYYGSDFIAPVMDLTVEAEALGVSVSWNSIPPSIHSHLTVNDMHIIDRLASNFLSLGRIPVFLESIKTLREIDRDDKIICGYVTGPLTLAGNVFGYENTLKLVLKDPRKLSEIIDLLQRLSIPYLRALVENGADCIIVADPLSALISPQHYTTFSLEPLKTIVDEVERLNRIAVLHTCGNATRILRLMAETGAHILSIDKYVDIGFALTSTNRVIMGNVPTTLFLMSAEKVSEYTLSILNISMGRRHIIASGCEIPPYSNPECIKAMVSSAKSFSIRS